MDQAPIVLLRLLGLEFFTLIVEWKAAEIWVAYVMHIRAFLKMLLFSRIENLRI